MGTSPIKRGEWSKGAPQVCGTASPLLSEDGESEGLGSVLTPMLRVQGGEVEKKGQRTTMG